MFVTDETAIVPVRAKYLMLDARLIERTENARLVVGNSFLSNFNASVIGCLFYFATLTEIPILEALMKNGMGSGPALALLLAGPALSIPSILVIRSVLGNLKTVVFVILVVIMSTIVGMGYGALFPENPVLNTPSGTPAMVSAAVQVRLVRLTGLSHAGGAELLLFEVPGVDE